MFIFFKAIQVYRINGTLEGNRYFDLKSWNSGVGGIWIYHYVDNGTFFSNEINLNSGSKPIHSHSLFGKILILFLIIILV